MALAGFLFGEALGLNSGPGLASRQCTTSALRAFAFRCQVEST
jgi:hypothetical protein